MRLETLARLTVGLVGLFNGLAGAALLLVPQWFFAHIAPFEPFNRHFMADIGAFASAVGLGLIWAAYQPQQLGLLALGIGANAVHSLNHAYDAWLEGSGSHFLRDGLPLLLATLALGWAYAVLKGENNGKGSAFERV